MFKNEKNDFVFSNYLTDENILFDYNCPITRKPLFPFFFFGGEEELKSPTIESKKRRPSCASRLEKTQI